MQSTDVVIVGAGIGGSALAKALADDGLDVLVLEQSEVYEDRVRGESMVPWGVAEARDVGRGAGVPRRGRARRAHVGQLPPARPARRGPGRDDHPGDPRIDEPAAPRRVRGARGRGAQGRGNGSAGHP